MTPAARSARSRLGRVVVGLLVLLAAACGSPAGEPAPPAPSAGSAVAVPVGPLAQQLAGAVSVDGAWVHLQALQKHRRRERRQPGRRDSRLRRERRVRGRRAALRRFRGEHPDLRRRPTTTMAVRPGPAATSSRRPAPGTPAAVVMIGAHLDSVPEGPGIVDNGSGVASLLEIATRLGADPAVQNTVRFAFFGHEETRRPGLDRLRREPARRRPREDQAVPERGHGGLAERRLLRPGRRGPRRGEAGPPGSATIGRVLADQLAATGVTAPEIIEFVGDDESPFIEAGIPVGGAENGDAKEKTAEQAEGLGRAGRRGLRPLLPPGLRPPRQRQPRRARPLPAGGGRHVAHFATSTVQLR